MENFLKEHDDNIVAIHCKAGKGRTGTVIAVTHSQKRSCPNPATVTTTTADPIVCAIVVESVPNRTLTAPYHSILKKCHSIVV